MRTTFIAASLLVLSSAALAQQAVHNAASPAATAAPDFKAHVLSRAELDRLLAHPGKLLVLDVRRPDEIATIGSLPVYLTIQVADIEKQLAWIPKDRTIVTVSNHAKRAGKVADLLTSKGFKVAGAVGVQTYEQEGGTLTKIHAPARRTAAAVSKPL